LTAQKPGGQWSALCVGRGRSKNRIAKRLFTSPPGGVAVLRDLVALYDAGRREPLPLPLKTSCAWAEARRDGEDPVEAARDKWESPRFHFGDNTEKAHERVWGRGAPLEALLPRLGELAEQLWRPVLLAEGDAW
jgi:exodeoxyribonuclease V gamma subunit